MTKGSIYRGYFIWPHEDGKRWCASKQDRGTNPEICATEEDAQAWVDSIWRKKRAKVDQAVREAITGRPEPVSSKGAVS